MLIPGFLEWLDRRFPGSSVSMDNPAKPLFDVLFVDFNPIIYEALWACPGQGTTDFNEWFAVIFRNLDNIVQLAHPSTLIYISVDGTAPFAKNDEQRRRRVHASDVKKMITTGTEFMTSLHIALRAFIEERTRNSEVWGLPNVVYNSCHTPGEGEHKFFEFVLDMRNRGLWNENAVSCLFSPDPDVLFEGLVMNMRNFCLMAKTENTSTSSETGYTLTWGPVLVEYICLEMECDYTKKDEVIQDFVALSFLLGNDFIPQHSGIGVSMDNLPEVFLAYRKVCSSCGRNFVKGVGYDRQAVAVFLDEVANTIGAEDVDAEPGSVEAVVEAFYFILKYYKEGLPSWSWHYRFGETPSLRSLAQRFRDMTEEDVPVFQKDEPLKPIEQICAIMQPSSNSAVPEVVRSLLMTEQPDRKEHRARFTEKENLLSPAEKLRNTVYKGFVIRAGRSKEIDNVFPINWNINFDATRPPCVPSLYSLPGTLCVVKREPVVEVSYKELEDIPKTASAVKDLVNKVVLVGWPYWRPALVVGVSGASSRIYCHRKDHLKVIPATSRELVVEVRALKFTDMCESGLELSSEIQVFPFAFTKPVTPGIMERFRPIPQRSWSPELPVYVIGQGPGSCLSGRQYRIRSCPRPVTTSLILAMDEKDWVTLTHLAEMFEVLPPVMLAVVSKLTGSVSSSDIGMAIIRGDLSMESVARRHGDEEFRFSHVAVAMVRDYFDGMGPLHAVIKGVTNVKDLPFTIDEMLGETPAVLKRAADMRMEFNMRYSCEYRHAQNKMVSTATLRKIERAVMNIASKSVEIDVQVDDVNVIWPGKARDEVWAGVSCGSRAVYISGEGTVPFGTMGTVVGTGRRNRFFYVIADEEFPGGTTLNGRLRTSRGFMAHASCLVRHG